MATPQKTTRLKASDVREETEIVIDLGDGTDMLCRKVDMTLLVFEGRLPMPMLQAAQKMIEMPSASPMERLAAMSSEGGQALVATMRQHVVSVALDPKVSLEQTSDPDVIPVSYFKLPQLMTIWTKTAIVPKVTAEKAARFRRKSGADTGAAAPASESVPEGPEFVDLGAAEYHGR